LLLTHGNQPLVKAILGIIIVAFAIFMLLNRRPHEVHGSGRDCARLRFLRRYSRRHLRDERTLPAVPVAIVLDRRPVRRIHGQAFLRLVQVTLIAIGGVQVVQAVRDSDAISICVLLMSGLD
jgi:hypothetical protein